MLHYILQTVAFQLFFLIIYDLFLKKETFFNWNRFYLLITAVASVVLPFIKLESFRTIVPKQYVIRLPEVIIGDVQTVAAESEINKISEVAIDSSFIWSWDYLLYAGMILACILLAYKIIKLSVLIEKNPKRWRGNLIIVSLLKSSAAFSFFNYVFLGEWIKEEEKESILKHELVHVHQKHSLDQLLFEVLRIVFWFNPLIYMYQNRITTLHEYIADAKAMKQTNKKQYYEKLLSQVFDTEQISFTNTFFNQSLIKKRILMLSKSKSNRIHLLKYALLIPMVFGMLVYTSSYGQKSNENEIFQDDRTNQDLTLQELTEKYYQEIVDISKKQGVDRSITEKYIPNTDKYIHTKDEVARLQAFFKYISEGILEKKRKNGTLMDKDVEEYENMSNKYKTYDDYLAHQKTEEAKLKWESQSKNGVLRLVVNDTKNLSEKEKERMEQKIALIEKDDFFHSLLITDGKSSTTMQIHNINGKEIPGRQDIQETESTVYEDIEVPFSVIEEVPTTEDCKNLLTNEEKRGCFSDYISDYVNRNFNTNLAKELSLTGKQHISVLFKIGKDGTIKDVMARAPHPALEAEAKRVIRSLPQMIPGKQKGKTVVVPYSLPILFQLQGDSYDSEGVKDGTYSFTNVEIAPVSKECQQQEPEKERRSCTIDIITSYINKNFNIIIAKENGLTGEQRIAVMFKINKEGKITDVMVRAPHPQLEAEAKRVIGSLPQMIPGTDDGKPVDVLLSLPIVFQINE